MIGWIIPVESEPSVGDLDQKSEPQNEEMKRNGEETDDLAHEEMERFGKRAPMRFGKRAPMRFGKREPMRFGKREYDDEDYDSEIEERNIRAPMRFGKREVDEDVGIA